jgi:glutamate synthase domain-containing protein 2
MFNRRYVGLYGSVATLAGTAVASATGHITPLWNIASTALFCVGVRDVWQTKHSVLRNYPILGHLRYLLEFIRPEVRQYFIESETEETPVSRAQRSVVIQRSKNEVDSRAFGTELNVKEVGHEWLNQSLAPSEIADQNFRVVVGANRAQPYSISVLNISAMSFGALSPNAILALNLGAKRGGFIQDTGEGSISPYHREHGGDLIWQIASGYFGCRTASGHFDMASFVKQANNPQVKMIEIKLSQGAKPGHGGVLPAAKVTAEIAATRGVPVGQDCISPARHSAFSTPEELLVFIDGLRTLAGGKPTGIKMCVGAPWEVFSLGKAMLKTGILPDFIVIDGAEGGTGAAPLEFVDHVGTPLQEGLLLVHNMLKGLGLRDQVKIGASGKLFTAYDIARTLALGADWVNSARGFMFAVGCIQAQKCNTGRCPTGVATQDKRRQEALVVPDKAERVYNFHHNTMHALKELVQAAGVHHPSELRPYHFMRRVGAFEVQPLSELLDQVEPGDLLKGVYRQRVFEKWWPLASSESFNLSGEARTQAEATATQRPVFWCAPAQPDGEPAPAGKPKDFEGVPGLNTP